VSAATDVRDYLRETSGISIGRLQHGGSSEVLDAASGALPKKIAICRDRN